jgi:hypothetical protein
MKFTFGSSLLSIALTLSLSSASSAWATGQEGKGAGGFVCNSPELPGAMLLDLWEGEQRGYLLAQSNRPVVTQIEDALSRAKTLGWGAPFIAQIRESLSTAYRIAEPLRAQNAPAYINPRLKFPDDAESGMFDAHCREVGIARWVEPNQKLQLDTRLIALNPYFEQETNAVAKSGLSLTHQAATWFHEAVYDALRATFGDRIIKNSLIAREMTLQAFLAPGQDLGKSNLSTTNSNIVHWDGINSFAFIELDSSECQLSLELLDARVNWAKNEQPVRFKLANAKRIPIAFEHRVFGGVEASVASEFKGSCSYEVNLFDAYGEKVATLHRDTRVTLFELVFVAKELPKGRHSQ